MPLNFNLAVIVGLAAGFVFANLVLVLTWYLLKRKLRKEKRQDEEEKLATMMARPSARRRQDMQVRGQMDSIPSENHKRYTVSGQRFSSIASRHTPSSPSVRPEQRRIQTGTSPLRNQLGVPPTRNTSARSADTASVYSTASAPHHLHDELLRSQPIYTGGAVRPGRSTRDTPANVHRGKAAPVRPLVPGKPRNRRSVMNEMLAPETYDRMRRSQWQGYPALDPFYSDKFPHTRILSRSRKQPLLPLHDEPNEPALVPPPVARHVVPLLYGRGLSSRNAMASSHSPPLQPQMHSRF